MVGRASLAATLLLLATSGCSSSDDSTATAFTAPPLSASAPSTVVDSATITSLPPATAESGTILIFPLEFGDPAEVEIPPAAEGTGTYMKGEGRAAVVFVAAAEPLASDRNACTQAVGRLDAAGSPEEILDAIASIPDEPTIEILSGLWTAATHAIAECNAGGVSEERYVEFVWQWRLADRRLGEIGVAG